MDIIFTIAGVIFIALMLTAALTFGFALISFFVAVTCVTAFLIAMREFFRRWRFVQQAESHRTAEKMIEGEYKDITQHHKEKP